MKRLISIFIVLFSFNALADLPDVVAFVNDRPITKYDFESRKKMIVELNNIDISDPGTNNKVTSNILNILIEEELLNQQAEEIGRGVSEEEVNNSILAIEQKNKMPKGGMKAYMNVRNVRDPGNSRRV